MIKIEEISIIEIQEMYVQKKISIKELIQEYLERIDLYDQGEEKLNSILEINPDVYTIAKELGDHRPENASKLYGVPILLKDNIDTKDGMHTSTGSLALANSYASRDADIVKTLREKGAIIMGKTNMTEFANYMTKGMKPSYSSRGGHVKSPYKKEGDPSGSSTGSAVAVSANLCAASIGTDTSGSIIFPAKANGIVGFRPSIRTFSQKGIIPISFTLDTSGPMTRTVMDSAIIYSELAKIQSVIEEVNIKDIVIGIDQASFEDITKEKEKKAANAIKSLKQTGTTLKSINIPKVSKDDLKGIQRYEFKYSINKYLENLKKDFPIHSLEDIIEFNNKNPKETLRYGQTLLLDAEQNTKGDLSESAYHKLLQDREEVKKEVLKQLNGIHICILFQENIVLQYTGLPIITIPMGLNNNGMPNNIILTALDNSNLLNYSHKVEQLIGRRVPPNL